MTATSTPSMKKSVFRRKHLRNRQGGAAVEAALMLPVVFIFMLGTLEICGGLYLKETLTVCAFESVRVGVRRGATAQDCIDRAIEVLEERQVNFPENDPAYGVFVEPTNFNSLSALDPITVTIRAPSADNTVFIFDHLANRDVEASVTMVREFDN